MMRGSTTVMTVDDVMKSLAYYRDKLGFDLDFEYGQPTFCAGLCSGNVSIHLVAAAETQPRRQPGSGGVVIFVDDVDAVHADLAKRGATITVPLGDRDYGLRDFNVADLDGNMLVFGAETKSA